MEDPHCSFRPDSCLLTDQNDISNRNRGFSIDASYQVSVHLAKQFQSRRIFKISQKSSPLKTLGQMNRNLVGCIYGGPL
jgi:hypothetical protein